MSGTCPSCAKDDHDHHNGYYDVKIQRKGHPLPSRKVECGCPVCVRRANNVKEETSVLRRGFLLSEYTSDPCALCRHQSHWQKLFDGQTSLMTEEGGNCYGCPRCKAVAA